MLEISTVRITDIQIEKKDNDEIKISGKYNLISNKGKLVAKQSFNGYGDMQLTIDLTSARDFVSDLESNIEIAVGIQEAVKEVRGE